MGTLFRRTEYKSHGSGPGTFDRTLVKTSRLVSMPNLTVLKRSTIPVKFLTATSDETAYTHLVLFSNQLLGAAVKKLKDSRSSRFLFIN
jgi:hypothetical protein